MNKSAERRQAFRVTCQALVEIKQVDKDTIEGGLVESVFTGSEFALLNEFQRLDRDCQQIASSLTKIDRNLLDYLKLTQRKIDQLGRIVMAGLPSISAIPEQTVELSETGINFCASRFFYQDSCLALRLVFLPHYQSVILFAKVVRCHPRKATKGLGSEQASESFSVAVEFLSLAETARRFIAQQVLKVQRQTKVYGVKPASSVDGEKP